MTGRRHGPLPLKTVQTAPVAVHAEAAGTEDTDWSPIVALPNSWSGPFRHSSPDQEDWRTGAAVPATAFQASPRPDTTPNRRHHVPYGLDHHVRPVVMDVVPGVFHEAQFTSAR